MEWKQIQPNIWKPEKEGDEIEGVLVKVDEKSGKFDSPVYHLECKDGQKVIFGTAVLDDRMSYINPSDHVKIVYKGIQQNSKGQDVKIFEVYKGQLGPKVEDIIQG